MLPAIPFIFSLLLLGVSAGYSQVINAGISGNTTLQLLQRIDEDVIDHHPELTILMVGTNDMLNSRKMMTYQEYGENLDFDCQEIKNRGESSAFDESSTGAWRFTNF